MATNLINEIVRRATDELKSQAKANAEIAGPAGVLVASLKNWIKNPDEPRITSQVDKNFKEYNKALMRQ